MKRKMWIRILRLSYFMDFSYFVPMYSESNFTVPVVCVCVIRATPHPCCVCASFYYYTALWKLQIHVRIMYFSSSDYSKGKYNLFSSKNIFPSHTIPYKFNVRYDVVESKCWNDVVSDTQPKMTFIFKISVKILG